MKLYPYTRRARLAQRLTNWLNALTAACLNNEWFVFAVIVFSLVGTWVIWKGW
jgi:hypothetical protein